MIKKIAAALVIGMLSVAAFLPASAQEGGIGERLGERLDRSLSRLTDELRQEWTQIRNSVERMGVQGRVYSRLRWDKEIDTGSLRIEVQDDHNVVLQGSVRSDAARRKAVQLARDTVGVNQVFDELAVAEPAATP